VQSTPRPAAATRPSGGASGRAAQEFRTVARALLTEQEKQFLGFALREFTTCESPLPSPSRSPAHRLLPTHLLPTRLLPTRPHFPG